MSFGLMMAVAAESLLKEDQDHRAEGRELAPTANVWFGAGQSMAFSLVWQGTTQLPNGPLVERHALRIVLGGKRPGTTRSTDFRQKAVVRRDDR